MVDAFFGVHEIDFLIDISISLIAGVLIGVERESRSKPAGINTHSFVIGGSMIFTYLSALVDPNSTSRIAAQFVTGIGFLGAGVILKGEIDGKKGEADSNKVINLTTRQKYMVFSSYRNGNRV
jgi:putative Mg2+ transporter-C (MgtC) family protein